MSGEPTRALPSIPAPAADQADTQSVLLGRPATPSVPPVPPVPPVPQAPEAARHSAPPGPAQQAGPAQPYSPTQLASPAPQYGPGPQSGPAQYYGPPPQGGPVQQGGPAPHGGYSPPPGAWATPPSPWGQQPPPPEPPKRRRRIWPLVLTGLVVFALVGGLLAWQPWVTRAPSPVTAVATSSQNATSATITWTPPKGGTQPDHYLISRDGQQVGQAADGKTSFTDTGLTPGSAHYYTVIGASGGLKSQPTAQVKVVTMAPPPIKLSGTKATWSTVTFNWSPSPLGPTPSQYVIYDGPSPVATVPGSTTTYTIGGLSPGHGCECTIVAKWGTAASAPSAALTAAALDPPLNGELPVVMKTTSTPGGDASLSAGDHWDDQWTFAPQCSGTACTMTVHADLAAPGFSVKEFTVLMHGSGSHYSGTAKAQISSCVNVDVTNTITLNLAANNGGIRNGGWTAWTGAMDVSSPYTVTGDEYCPTQSWSFGVTPG
jgi:hypothetical protein